MDNTLPEIPRNQRVLIEHTTGPHAGFIQIGGHSDDFAGQPPPSTLTIEAFGRSFVCGLIRSSPRALFYREITPPKGLATYDKHLTPFDRNQR